MVLSPLPFRRATLLVMVLKAMDTFPVALLRIPPPPPLTILPLMVLFVISRKPRFSMPPPRLALLPLMVLLYISTFAATLLKMPPPLVKSPPPPASVKKAMIAFPSMVQLNICKKPLLLMPAPNPWLSLLRMTLLDKTEGASTVNKDTATQPPGLPILDCYAINMHGSAGHGDFENLRSGRIVGIRLSATVDYGGIRSSPLKEDGSGVSRNCQRPVSQSVSSRRESDDWVWGRKVAGLLDRRT